MLQIPIIILGGFLLQIAVFILTWSLLITANNLAGTWFIKGLKEGENSYVEMLKESAKKAKWYNILVDELSPLILFTIPNLVIWFIITLVEENIIFLFITESLYSYIIIITGACALHGIVLTFRNFLYIIRLKKSIKTED